MKLRGFPSQGFVAVLAFVFAWGTAFPAAAAGTIDEVAAEVVADRGAMPPLVKARMEKSVAAIAAQLVTGQPLASYEARRLEDERTIGEVFDKVLVGYSVESVRIEPGNDTRVYVYLVPWTDRVEEVEVELQVEGLKPEVEAMVRRDVADIDSVFRQSLSGLPLAATDWTNGVLKQAVNAYLDTHLPEFRADFDIHTEEKTRVSLTLYPKMPVVRTIDLAMRSDTIPNFSLLEKRARMQEAADVMLGVPVAFAARHEAEFAKSMEEALDSSPEFRALELKTRVTLTVGENTSVMSRSDTEKYRLRLEGWSDIGSDHGDRDLRFRAHAGWMLSREDEIFLQADFFPQDLAWGWALGYERGLLPQLFAQARYDMRDKRWILAVRGEVAPRWGLRYEYDLEKRGGEAGLSYRLHDFLRLEFVRDTDEGWLRLIGDF